MITGPEPGGAKWPVTTGYLLVGPLKARCVVLLGCQADMAALSFQLSHCLRGNEREGSEGWVSTPTSAWWRPAPEPFHTQPSDSHNAL